MVEDYFDIKRWLSDNEKVVYDTESNNLSVNKIKKNRGIITDRRTFFLGHGEKTDLYHNSVTSIDYKQIRHFVLIIAGVVLSGFGLLLILIGEANSHDSFNFFETYGVICIFISIAIIVLFFRTRHFRLDIFSNDTKTRVIGNKDTIQKIRNGISTNGGKPSEGKKRICNVCGTNIPGGKTVCPSCGDTYH